MRTGREELGAGVGPGAVGGARRRAHDLAKLLGREGQAAQQRRRQVAGLKSRVDRQVLQAHRRLHRQVRDALQGSRRFRIQTSQT